MHMKDFVEFLVKQLVTKPDEVVIEETNDNGSIRVTVKVADEDMGLIIGKEGKIIKSIRGLARAKAIIDNVRVSIDLIDHAENSTNA